MATATPNAKGIMPRGLSIHVGLNAVSPSHYGGWDGRLAAAEFDATDMGALARDRGMTSTVLSGTQATRSQVLAAVRSAVRSLTSDDMLFISYSGHGGRVPNNAHVAEEDRQSLSWCLYDGQLLEPELWLSLREAKSEARVLLLRDCCQSGTVTRALPLASAAAPATTIRTKNMPMQVSVRTYVSNRSFYDKLHKDLARAAPERRCSDPPTLVLSGAHENQIAFDEERNGVFTRQVLALWNGGVFRGNYSTFHKRLLTKMPPSQSPSLYTRGKADHFLKQRPFTV